MATVLPGRFTAAEPEPNTTLFLIGMRFNQPLKVGSWLPVVRSMPKMLRFLVSEPETGLISFHSWLGRTTVIVSYWRSPDHLRRFAADADSPHLQPWRDFNQKLAGRGDVGVWHETYQMSPGTHEGIYSDMPPYGLAKAAGPVAIGPGTQTFKQRFAPKIAAG